MENVIIAKSNQDVKDLKCFFPLLQSCTINLIVITDTQIKNAKKAITIIPPRIESSRYSLKTLVLMLGTTPPSGKYSNRILVQQNKFTNGL